MARLATVILLTEVLFNMIFPFDTLQSSKMIFILNSKSTNKLESHLKCSLCKNPIKQKYVPMEQWKIEGPLCGKCYSKKIHDHYPGKHTRANLDKD